ncbi:MAG: PEP-CTERM sorting domain-containing protein [Rhodoferax sp.]|nr:PEP-CTERM sorting domain-containing protein [Rhodoferax sp.]
MKKILKKQRVKELAQRMLLAHVSESIGVLQTSQELKMIKKILPMAIAAAFAAGSVHAAGFNNGNFETGDLTGWTGAGGSFTTAQIPAPVNPAVYVGAPNNTITNVGADPITGAATVYSGAHSVRVNDSTNDYSVSTLKQSVTGYTDNSIFFAWNAVLEASHGLTDSDYFSLTLRDDTVGDVLVNRGYSSAGSIGGGTTGVTWTAFGNWFSSGWVVEQIDLLALNRVGHDFTLTLLASDCPYGGHAGYVYLDGFGSVNPPVGVPEPGSLALLGLGLAGLAASRRKKSV